MIDPMRPRRGDGPGACSGVRSLAEKNSANWNAHRPRRPRERASRFHHVGLGGTDGRRVGHHGNGRSLGPDEDGGLDGESGSR